MVAPHALVAQLDRASDFDSEGREFESLRARHFGTVRSGYIVTVYSRDIGNTFRLKGFGAEMR
jgi:hypothetical protein